MVIYDERGDPWIVSNRRMKESEDLRFDIEDIRDDYSLKPGAYVPHANDDGTYKAMLDRIGICL